MRALLLLTLLTPASLAQSTWFVDVNAAPGGDGSPGAPFVSIQDTIDAPATLAGDTISIAPGVYLESLDLQGKSLRLEGDPADRPVIRGDGLARLLTIDDGEGPGTEIVALEFFAGVALGTEDFGGGAAVRDSTARFEDCVFTNCFACSRGGALYGGNSDVELEGCHFERNRSDRGGAVFLEGSGDYTVLDCDFVENYGDECETSSGMRGGAMRVSNAVATIDACRFLRNTTYSGGALAINSGGSVVSNCVFIGQGRTPGVTRIPFFGGAVNVRESVILRGCLLRDNVSIIEGGGARGGRLERCVLENNESRSGGGAYESTLFDSIIIGNRAVNGSSNGTAGGGTSSCQHTRCVLVGNQSAQSAGGADNSLGMDRCTVINNVGVASGAGVEGSVSNSIVWGNRSALPPELTRQLTGSGFPFSIVQGEPTSVPGPPLLFDLAGGDAHLLPGSPAIDAADPSLPLDPDGSRADIGALVFDPAYRVLVGRYCIGKVSSVGCEPSLNALGPASASGPPAVLIADGLPEATFGLLVLARNAATMDLFGGTLCLGGALVRSETAMAMPWSGCGAAALFTLDPTEVMAGPGDLVFAQVWFRDPGQADGTGVGLTDAVVMTVQ